MTGSSHVESPDVPQGVSVLPPDPSGVLREDYGSSLVKHQSKKRKHRPETVHVDPNMASTSTNHQFLGAINDPVTTEPKKKKRKKDKVSADGIPSVSSSANDDSARGSIPVGISQPQGVELPRKQKKRKALRDSDGSVDVATSQVQAEPATPNEERKKKKKKKKYIQPQDDDSGPISSATEAIMKDTTGTSSQASSGHVNISESSLPKKKSKRSRNPTEANIDTRLVAETVAISPNEPSTDISSQPNVEESGVDTHIKKKKSKKVKRHRAEDEDSNPDSLTTNVPTTSAPPAAIASIIPPSTTANPAHGVAPSSAPSTIQSAPAPSIEQLAQIQSTDDLLRAIARTPTRSVLPSGDSTNATSRAGDSGASISKVKKVRTAKSAPARPSSAALSLLRAGDGDDANSILWSQWMSSAELKKVCEAQGIDYKQGKFTQTESELVENALQTYRVGHNLSQQEIAEIVFAKRGGRSSPGDSFWQDIARQVPGRPLVSIYAFVRRKYNPLGNQGSWTEQEDHLLRNAVLELGTMWEKVGVRVGRTAGDCRDRYRNHIAHKGKNVYKASPTFMSYSTWREWTEEEEARLTEIVRSFTVDVGKDVMHDIPWTSVAERMGQSRSRQQCRIKWQDSLSKKYAQPEGEGVAPRWGSSEQFCLVQELKDLEVHDESEINWSVLASTAQWNYWSGHEVRRRWMGLKRLVEGHESLSFADVLGVLKNKYAVPPEGTVLAGGRWTSAKKRSTPDPIYRSGSIVRGEDDEQD